MVSLELGIDASGVASGGAQASSALSGIAQAAALAANSLAGSSAAAAGFGAALATAMPWITAIGAALSGVATGILLFTNRTDAGAEATRNWTTAIKEWRTSLSGVVGTGGDSPLARAEAISSLLAATERKERLGSLRFGEAEIGGEMFAAVDPLERLIPGIGQQISNERGLRGIRRGVLTDSEGNFVGQGDRRQRIVSRPDLLASLQRFQIQALQGQPAPPLIQRPLGGISLRSQLGAPAPGFDGVSMSPFRQTIIDNQIGQRDEDIASAAQLQRMGEMRDLALDIGGALGDGAFDFLTGVSSAKDILGNLASQLGQGLTRHLAQQLTTGLTDLIDP